MSSKLSFWRKNVFTLTIIACLQFVVLTVLAMAFYPGGGMVNSTTSDVHTTGISYTTGYSFFKNFFSELGLTHVKGQSNVVSAGLFITALTLAGAGLTIFFAAYPQFFNRTTTGKALSWIGSIFGMVAGISFIGVAFTPADLFIDAHTTFVMWAFRSFMLAAVIYSIVMLREPHYPKKNALVFVIFAILLILYVLLLTFGPSSHTLNGLIIQATGQKIIVYASIISVLIQAWGAKKYAL
jgi:hypothetical protein